MEQALQRPRRWWHRRWIWLLIVLPLTAVVVVLGALHIIDFGASAEEISAAFADLDPQPRPERVPWRQRELLTWSDTSGSLPPILFIHGTPGSWDNWLTVMAQLAAEHDHPVIAYDRPGFGASGGAVVTTLADHADAARAVLEHLSPSTPAIVVGHSYGAPVAARLALDHPQLVAGLVMVAGALDPELERIFWYQRLAATPGIEQLLPSELVHSNQELYPLKAELEGLAPFWSSSSIPLAIVHGSKDTLVPVANVDFMMAAALNPPTAVILDPDANHFIPWQQPEMIFSAIQAVYQAALDKSR